MPATQEDIVFAAMRDGILNGEVPVGAFLSQRKLADQFDTSLITLRAALRRLENNGLIENVPRWGVRIPEDTPEQTRDRYFVREVLELAALARMRRNMTEATAARLKELAEGCDQLGGTGDAAVRKFAEVHHALHRFIVVRADSPLLLEQFDRLMARSLMLSNARRGWARGDRDPDHHQQLVKDLLTLTPARAANALRAHIRRGLDNELAAISI